MKISRLTFEGTADEFRAVASDLFGTGNDEATGGVPRRIESSGNEDTDLLRRLLLRAPIPEGQRAMYEALYQAGDDGLSADQLANAIVCTREQLNGVLGALGRRVNHTPGVTPLPSGQMPGISLVLEWKKDDDWWYSLKPQFRQVLKEVGQVQ